MAVALDDQIAKIVIWILYFVGLYFSLFWLSVLIFKPEENKKKKYKFEDLPEISIIMPMWNEEKNLEATIKSLFKLKYPLEKVHLFVVDDGSTDNSYKIAKELQKTFKFKLIKQENGGKHTAVNNALKLVKTPFFACLDVDGYVHKDSVRHIMEEFTDDNVAAVMPVMKVAETKNMLQKVQELEYILNIFLKYIIGKLDCIHVTPGPLSTYRTHIVRDELGSFKQAHKTEDLEMALRLQNKHYVLKQSLDAVIYTKVPETLKGFISQRTRWYHGTLLNVIDYKHLLFNRHYGEFGFFYMPLVAVTGLLGFIGVLTVIYLFLKGVYHTIKRWFLTNFDFTTYISSWSWNSTWIDYNYQTIFTSLVLFGLMFIFIYLSYFATNEKTGILRNIKATFTFLYFFFVYKFIVAYIWLKVFYRVIFKKENKWNKDN
ncbi:MAG: glycosyltransferase family 2 protein [Nanoarchaeales archaeon]|nr:glycosyltransferase family 2 protein [Nanoarchaeales archaeon]